MDKEGDGKWVTLPKMNWVYKFVSIRENTIFVTRKDMSNNLKITVNDYNLIVYKEVCLVYLQLCTIVYDYKSLVYIY